MYNVGSFQNCTMTKFHEDFFAQRIAFTRVDFIFNFNNFNFILLSMIPPLTLTLSG